MVEKSLQTQQHEATLEMFNELYAQLTVQHAFTALLVADLGGKGMLSAGFIEAFRNAVPADLPADQSARVAELLSGTADRFEALIEKAKASVKR